MKIWMLMLFASTILIVFLEAKLYDVGTTVFGLFSLGTLFLSALFLYLWVVVQSLYLRLEQWEFTKYEVNGISNTGFVMNDIQVRYSNVYNISGNIYDINPSFKANGGGSVNPAFGEELPMREIIPKNDGVIVLGRSNRRESMVQEEEHEDLEQVYRRGLEMTSRL